MQFPCYAHVVTCLPCGFRGGFLTGRSYPPRCENCGGQLEHYETTIETRQEWHELPRPGARTVRFERPRLVIGSPA